MAPEVSIAAPQGPFHRGEPITLEAIVANKDAASLSFAWNKADGSCGVAPSEFTANDTTSANFVFTPGADDLGDVCIRVRAKDGQGASASAQAEIKIVDRPAVVALMQVRPAAGTKAPLGSEVVVSAVATDPDPGETPAFTLALQTPDGKDVAFGTCEDMQRPAHEHCFVVTTPGAWVVAVKWSNDAPVKSFSFDDKLEVMADDDQPPCLVALPRAAQLVQDAREPLHFEASVVDDLDSFPTTSQGSSKARFQWSVSDSSSSTFLALVDQTDRVYALPNRYLPADELRVRVDVFDRVARPVTCKASDDVCGTGTCLQRMTWTVRFR